MKRALCLLFLAACPGPPPPARVTYVVPTAPVPDAGPPPVYAPTVDESALDRRASPCHDFYQYACGGWIAKTPIPEEESSWSRSFDVLEEKNEQALRAILERHAEGKYDGDPYAKELGQFYASCMDEDAVEKAGLDPLKSFLVSIDAIKDQRSLAKTLAQLHAHGISPLFVFDSQTDARDASQVIAGLFQGGLGLPDRDFYLETSNADLRAQYEAHVARMLELAGEKEAKQRATEIVDMEKRLAQASLTNVEMRDPLKLYHRMDRAGLKQLAAGIEWDVYFHDLKQEKLASMNVAQPAFFVAAAGVIRKGPWASVRAYLKWHLLRRMAPSLSKVFVDEDFEFRKVLTGAVRMPPRWKRCVRAADSALGEALAQPFVKATLGEEGKKSVEEMVAAVEGAMKRSLQNLPWMDDPTRAKALEKLARIRNKIGYPDKWRSYDGIGVDKIVYASNMLRAAAFEEKRRLGRIGKPVDRDEWEMTPPTVNAYYEPTLNEMVFPAGILQPPFFDGRGKVTMAMSYGAIGMVIGHELIHGFDDEGRQYDADGTLRDWWSPKVSLEFDRRADCVEKQYDEYVAIDDLHVKGKLTLGENLADLGGIELAYEALQANKKEAPPAAFSQEQQFFIGYAQAWCASYRPEALRLIVATNPHSPAKLRVNGPLSNLPQFASAFSCSAGSPMVRAKRCKIW